MNPEIAKHAKHMDVLKRITPAEDLEKAAAELREFQSKAPARGEIVSISLLPMQAKAAAAFAEPWS